MKKLLIILLFLVPFSAFCQFGDYDITSKTVGNTDSFQIITTYVKKKPVVVVTDTVKPDDTTPTNDSIIKYNVYFVDLSGVDSDKRNGKKGQEWKTLQFAISKAKSGDIIHINKGTYSISSKINISVGVSIQGDGENTILSSKVTGNFTLLLESSTEGTSGNQSISNLKLDGNSYTAYAAIGINRRSNVSIHDCIIENFNVWGIGFQGGNEPPKVFATGNKCYNNTIKNCAHFTTANNGCVDFNGQYGLQIYNNTITVNRADGLNGNCIVAVPGYNKNVKIHNNTLTKIFKPGVTAWDFAIELWDCLGGIEIYDNIINGSVDLGGYANTRGQSDYAAWVHHNEIGQSTLLYGDGVRGILVESGWQGLIIEKNYIKNVTVGIYFTQVDYKMAVEDVRISYNILNNIGVNDNGESYKGWGIYTSGGYASNRTVNNLQIFNNVIIGSTGSRSNMWGICLPNIGACTNVSIRNNIIENFDYCPIYGYSNGGGTLDKLSIENNIFYNCGNSNSIRYSNFNPKNATIQNNIIDNPGFISSNNFHLQSSSPAVNAGLNVGLQTDYDNVLLDSKPEIGCFQFK